jgi:nicotinate-nucleotide--dimethylbenzimidazole phosphoribosyltransferase
VISWGAVPTPSAEDVGTAPETGRLEPALRWLARCQGAWPPRPPRAARRIDVDGSAAGSLPGGAARADEAVDEGADLLVVSSSGDQAAGVVVLAVLLDLEPVRAVGTAGGPDWTRLTVAVRDGLRRARAHRADPAGLLEATGAGVVAELGGLLAQSAARRTPALLDGSSAVAAAALVAGRLAPGASTWWLAGQAPPGPAARAAHAELALEPLLDLGLGLPVGADLAAQVLEAGIGMLGGAGA